MLQTTKDCTLTERKKTKSYLTTKYTKYTKEKMNNNELLFKDECFAIQGAIFEVYREMGCGFLDAVYQECLSRELARRQIPFVAQPELILSYKNEPLNQTYIPDFICYNQIIVEIKAMNDLRPDHQAQIFNYLRASKLKLGLLVNFGHFPKVQVERIAF